MTISYDSEVHALYIGCIETTVNTMHVAEGIAVDYAADGRIAGIEILDAGEHLRDPEIFRRVVLEDVALSRPALRRPAGY